MQNNREAVVTELLSHRNTNDNSNNSNNNNILDINQTTDSGTTALFLACEQDQPALVRRLLLHGADPNLCPNDGASPLYIACQYGHEEVVKLLLEDKRVNVNKRTAAHNATALLIASQKGLRDIVSTLLAAEADTSITTRSGFNAEALALRNGHKDIAVQIKNAERERQQQKQQ